MWALSARTAKANAAVRAWVEKAQAAGRIKYPTYPGPAGTDPAEVRRWEHVSVETCYRSILEALSVAAKQ